MRVLVTGGAGFIGSHIVDALVARGDEVTVLDDLSHGSASNIPRDVRLVVGDVADPDAVANAMTGVELVFHQAARGSVPRSVRDPLGSDRANAHGTLSVLKAAYDEGARRVVVASSSSVYGGASPVPTPEGAPLSPKSPYAVSKVAAEQYTRVFAELYGLETIVLRYFNVFGPRQRVDSPYAAVIPLFIDAMTHSRELTVHGDGLQRRDFTYVADVVAGNMAAADASAETCSGGALNVAAGGSHSLLDLIDALARVIGTEAKIVHADPRPGDVRTSGADITAARERLGFVPNVSFDEGLRRTVAWLGSAGAGG